MQKYLMALFVAANVAASPLDAWQFGKLPEPCYSVVDSGSKLYGVFRTAQITTGVYNSGDGQSWGLETNVFGTILGIASGGGLTMFHDTNSIYVKEGAGVWKQKVLGFANDLTCIQYFNGSFFLPGGNGSIWKTQNGDAWGEVKSPTTNVINRLDVVNGCLFIKASSTNLIWYSRNGVDWLSGKSPFEMAGWFPISFGNGTYVATGPGIMTSSNLVDWAQIPFYGEPAFGETSLGYVRYANGYFVALGSGHVWWSSDAQHWIGGPRLPSFANAAQILFTQNRFLVLGDYWNVSEAVPPVNASPTLSISSSPVLTIEGTPGAKYAVQTTATVEDTNSWSTITEIYLPYSPFTWVDTAKRTGKQFYRLILRQ